jgi:hypothetical protein
MLAERRNLCRAEPQRGKRDERFRQGTAFAVNGFGNG